MPRCLPVRATEGIIHVWRADLASVEDGFEQLLHEDELARAALILSERKRVLWARSRGLLRALLGRYLERDPRELRFASGPHGKPALLPEGPAPAADLRFNLSWGYGFSGGFHLILFGIRPGNIKIRLSLGMRRPKSDWGAPIG